MEKVEDKRMMAFCGTYCNVCDWREKTNCAGCQQNKGQMFFGQCDKANCCMEKGYEHCGQCNEMPCEKLLELFADKEHGDNGERLENLRNWGKGIYVFEKLRDGKTENERKNIR